MNVSLLKPSNTYPTSLGCMATQCSREKRVKIPGLDAQGSVLKPVQIP